jgi:hypothetical protein
VYVLVVQRLSIFQQEDVALEKKHSPHLLSGCHEFRPVNSLFAGDFQCVRWLVLLAHLVFYRNQAGAHLHFSSKARGYHSR